MSTEERDKWNAIYRQAATQTAALEPSPLLARVKPPPASAWALDVAAGRGRNALALAEKGWNVVAVDVAAEGLLSMRSHPRITRLVVDLDTWRPPAAAFSLVLDMNYLNVNMTPHWIRALKPGGDLLAEMRLRRADTSSKQSDEAAHEAGSGGRFRIEPQAVRGLFSALELLFAEEEMEETAGNGRYHFRAP